MSTLFILIFNFCRSLLALLGPRQPVMQSAVSNLRRVCIRDNKIGTTCSIWASLEELNMFSSPVVERWINT